jgi:A/G-specific adenine glycosylase
MKTKNSATKDAFSSKLCAWFETHGRSLPWRETRVPYPIWLSEIMLQQTQVETVKDYYQRFLARFPDLNSLAAASEDSVLKLWEGLGYYARGRNMHRAAQIMVERHEGKFPSTLDEVMALPGVGRSTAGAVLTFAFGQKHPLLDGNVKRVLCRLYDVDEAPQKSAVERKLWEHSSTLLEPAVDGWTHNQAIMELGATLCTPREPNCESCPVQGMCDAYSAQTQQQRPVKILKKKSPHHHIGVGVISREDGWVLIQRRPTEGLLGGLWEFPGGKQEPQEPIEDTVKREIEEELGIDVEVGDSIAVVKHAYSHFKITLHAYHCRYLSGDPTPRAATHWRWVSLKQLDEYAFPRANRRVLDVLQSEVC